ncbi:hypothetical protein B0J13DRAFT_555948 [Dactylonectria estremocensis]|uniref:Uncharacterized protein n=1 Tax=Dactylonectria estremocensis TaxID=1079267 RepID=A0A9P9ESG8_9HYPO|nr:hypothetical protein B0J13DRAFT_555948 [Dactylonectria estremocensis]
MPLHWAAERGHKVVVTLLLEKGARVDSKDDLGRIPLDLAAEGGYEGVVALLQMASAVPALSIDARSANKAAKRETDQHDGDESTKRRRR